MTLFEVERNYAHYYETTTPHQREKWRCKLLDMLCDEGYSYGVQSKLTHDCVVAIIMVHTGSADWYEFVHRQDVFDFFTALAGESGGM